MIRKMTLKNFKSYINTQFDFVGTKDLPKKLIILYGANGSGKTNFIDAFNFLSSTFQTLNIHNMIMRFLKEEKIDSDSEQLPDIFENYSLKHLIKQYKTLNSTEPMSISFEFNLKGRIGEYFIEFDDEQILNEKLVYTLSKNKGVYFDVSNNSERFNSAVFSDEFISELLTLKRKYWGKHSIISLLNYIYNEYSKDFFNAGTINHLNGLLYYFDTMTSHLVDQKNDRNKIYNFRNLLPAFEEGKIQADLSDYIYNTEKLINYFFTNLYQDIESVYYKIHRLDNNQLEYHLFFKKKLENCIIDVDYAEESCGTQNLLKLLPFFLAANYNTVVAIDEIDRGIHDLLLSKLIDSVIPIIEGQLIITTHNTMLIDNYALKDYIYVINAIPNHEKKVECISAGDYRIQKSSNVLKNYLNGRFGGVPLIDSDFSFERLCSIFQNNSINSET